MCIKAASHMHTYLTSLLLVWAAITKNQRGVNVRLRCVVVSHRAGELPNGVCHVNLVDQETGQPGRRRRRRLFHIIPVSEWREGIVVYERKLNKLDDDGC